MTLFKETPGEMGKPEAVGCLAASASANDKPDQGKSG